MDHNHDNWHAALRSSDSSKRLEQSSSSKRLGHCDSLEETQIPLLGTRALRHPDCPGCKNDYVKSQASGPPVKLLFMISSVVLCNALPISSLYPFLYFMVDDFHIAPKAEDIGYYAGAVGSVFMIGRIITSVPWGIFADKYGRRSVFYLGLISIIILQPIFGIVNNFWAALATRFLLGAFNGMLGPLKAYASEVCNAESQAWGLTVVSTTWGLGLIVGPAMGGFLARPAINFPHVFGADSFFGRYPYLLPSILQAAFSLVTLVVVFYMPETIHVHGEEDVKDVEEHVKEEDSETIEGSLWLHWPLMASVAVYCVWSLQEISFTEVFSLWCVSPKESGGMSLSTADVGTILAISGFGMLCLQLAVFPRLASLLGPILVTRIPGIITIPIIMMFPFISLFSGEVEWVVINSLSVLRSLLSSMVITGSFLLVNNAVSTEDRGAANGVSLSAVSVFRAIGPAVAGALFSWSQTRRNAMFLPGSQLIFAILTVTCIITVFLTFPPFLPRQVNVTYVEWKETQTKKSHQQNIDQLSPRKNEGLE